MNTFVFNLILLVGYAFVKASQVPSACQSLEFVFKKKMIYFWWFQKDFVTLHTKVISMTDMKNSRFIIYSIRDALSGSYAEQNPNVLVAIDRVRKRRRMTAHQAINSDFYAVHSDINNAFETLAEQYDGK